MDPSPNPAVFTHGLTQVHPVQHDDAPQGPGVSGSNPFTPPAHDGTNPGPRGSHPLERTREQASSSASSQNHLPNVNLDPTFIVNMGPAATANPGSAAAAASAATVQRSQQDLRQQTPDKRVGFDGVTQTFVTGSSPASRLAQDAVSPPNQAALGSQAHGNGNGQADANSGAVGSSRPVIVDPPHLQEWRQKLFDTDGLIILTDEQYQTYFPHIDNVYSHRSTQRYKRKPFVSHYYDCRLKGRPPGTPKSDDPSKKKRRRIARELNQCDVKLKITEYFPGATLHDLDDASYTPITAPHEVLTPGSEKRLQVLPAMHSTPGFPGAAEAAAAGIAISSSGSGDGSPGRPVLAGTDGQKFWTIQRVNGHGSGAGVPERHKHDLARSDEVKKNSVMRMLAKREMEAKKAQQSRKVSGAAAATVRKHAKEADLKLHAACYCPFSQSVWIALEAKKLPYQYIEVDPHNRPTATQLPETNPRGDIPTIVQGDWSCSESPVILEYLEEIDSANALLPSGVRLKADCRRWMNHIETQIMPAFYSVLRGLDATRGHGHQPQRSSDQNPAAFADPGERLHRAITDLVLAADEKGPYFLGDNLSLVDIRFAPFALRLGLIMRPIKGWEFKTGSPRSSTAAPENETGAVPDDGHDGRIEQRWERWLEALEGNPHVKATVSAKELYTQTWELIT